MAIHIGKKIKEELYQQEISVTDFAKRITKSRNVIYDIFERKSMDTDLLYKVCITLNSDFFSLYSAQKELSNKHVKNFQASANNIVKNSEQTSVVMKQNQIQKNEIAYLKKIIVLLEEKLASK